MMRALATLFTAIAFAASSACGADRSATPAVPTSGPTAPTPVTIPETRTPLQSGPVTFNGLGEEGASVTSYSESGFTVLVTAGTWQVGANYGNPRPFVRFGTPQGTTTAGEIQLTGGGATFTFQSVDLYSSTTPIPYVITGLLDSTAVFTASGTVPNTFGQFRTVLSPDAVTVIDTLKIALSNAAAPCCTNPMGIDNITLGK